MTEMTTEVYPEIKEKIHEEINFYDTITTLTSAMDLISETVIGHHKRTAYIALKLGQQLDLNQKDLQKLVLSALIHDLGVFYLNQKFSDLKFDQPNNRHAKIGALLLEDSILDDFSDIIKYHHTNWNESDEPAPYLGQLLYIADRISVLILEEKPVLTQQKRINKTINHYSGTKFWPEGVEGFNQLATHEYFWLDAVSELKIQQELDNYLNNLEWSLNLQEVMEFSILTGHVIDFRSPFTATHSTGLAIISSHLASCFNFSQKEVQTMKVAGYLHDLGKLYVP
ncbi:MAG: HD domain-containing protein, partial [Halanaerobiaceae bacterium]